MNTQDSSPKFVVNNVRIGGKRCDAIVHGYDQGEQREQVMPELSKINGRRTIADFRYKFDQNEVKPYQNDDLIYMIREYIGEVSRQLGSALLMFALILPVIHPEHIPEAIRIPPALMPAPQPCRFALLRRLRCAL